MHTPYTYSQDNEHNDLEIRKFPQKITPSLEPRHKEASGGYGIRLGQYLPAGVLGLNLAYLLIVTP